MAYLCTPDHCGQSGDALESRRRNFYDLSNQARRQSPRKPHEPTSTAVRPRRVIPASRPGAAPSSQHWAQFNEKLGLVSQKSRFAKVIRYALARWQGLSHVLDDGPVKSKSNSSSARFDRAPDRKHAVFPGSYGGGEHWAVIASLVEICMCGWPPRRKGSIWQ